MENNTISESSLPQNSTRPGFITTLCILTWIGCAITLAGSLYAAFGPGPKEQVMKMTERMDQMEGKAKEFMESSVNSLSENIEVKERWYRPLGFIGVISVALCFIGSLQIWKLKRSGFFIYLAGELLYPILFLILLGGVTFGATHTTTVMNISNIMSMIIPVAFIVMYYANLKHLR